MIRIKGTKLSITKTKGFSWLSLLPALFYLANLYRMTGHSAVPYLVTMYAAGLVGIFKLVTDTKCRNGVYLLFCGLYLLCGTLNYLLIGNMTYRDVFQSIILFGIAVIMFAYPMTYFQGMVFYYLSLIAFIPAYFRNVSTALVLTSSGNYISVIIVLSASIYYIALHNSERSFRIYDLLPALIGFFLSVWGRGRGGILSCFLLLLLMTVYYIIAFTQGKIRKILIAVLVLAVVFGIVIIRNVNLVSAFMNLGKWRYRGTDNTARLVIWSSYIEKACESAKCFFLGAPLNQISQVNAYNGNLHNSFLQLHAFAGLLPLLAMGLLIVYSLINMFRNKQPIIAIALLAVVVRGLSDKFIFAQYGMPVMLYLAFYPFLGAALRKDTRNINRIG